MNIENVTINLEVVRSKGDYVVGRIGKVIEIDFSKQRVRVKWNDSPQTWLTPSAIEPTAIPYEIIPGDPNKRQSWPKYKLRTPQMDIQKVKQLAAEYIADPNCSAADWIDDLKEENITYDERCEFMRLVKVKRTTQTLQDPNDMGGTGHGDISYSDADPGL